VPGNTRKPLLLVDVDGVISLFGEGLDVSAGGRWLMVDGVPHFISHEAGLHLRELVADFELVWCTGWEENANFYLPSALSLPGALPFLTFEGRQPGRRHWKLGAIDEHAGADRPLAWIDDGLSDDCHAWAAARPGATLLVPTDAARGLTAVEAAILRSWARRPAAGSPPRRP
jgi:hypothetical protein